ncbi:MAG: HAD hydrolase-like protein [Pseudomonadota bacterium]
MHLLFDLDGTLTDPKPGILTCIKYALTHLDAPIPPDDELVGYIGPPLQQSMASLLRTDNAARVAEAVALYRERYATTGLYENEVNPGIVPALRHLRAQADSIHVATSKPAIYARRIMDHFGLSEFFDGVYGSELDGVRSDKTELIAYLLEREKIPSGLSTMIGDRSHDVIGARGNGVRPLGVLWGYGSREELIMAGADGVCDAPEMLHSLL